MVDKVNSNASYSGTVEKYVGTAYDTVKLVADNIDVVVEIGNIPDLAGFPSAIKADADAAAASALAALGSENSASTSADIATAAIADLTTKAEIAGDATQAFDTAALGVTGNITVSGTVDLRDIAADGAVLDLIEPSATADQSNAEIKVAYEANTNTEVFTTANQTTVNSVENGADITDATNVEAANAVMDSDISESEGMLRKTAAGTYEAIRSNLTATGAPAASNDSSAGYAVGSVWIDVTNDLPYICVDASVGAAVWELTSAGAGAGSVTIVSASLPVISSGGNTPVISMGEFVSTFVPNVVGAIVVGTGWVTTNSATYMRIGNFVYLYGSIVIITVGTGASGAVSIDNLPFTVADQTGHIGNIIIRNVTRASTLVDTYTHFVSQSIRFSSNLSGGSSDTIDITDLQDGGSSTIGFSIVLRIA